MSIEGPADGSLAGAAFIVLIAGFVLFMGAILIDRHLEPQKYGTQPPSEVTKERCHNESP